MNTNALTTSINEFIAAMENYFQRAGTYRRQCELPNNDDDGERLLEAQHQECKARRIAGIAAQQLAERLESIGHDATNVLKVSHYIDGGGGDLRYEPTLWAQTKAQLQRLTLNANTTAPAKPNAKPNGTDGDDTLSNLPDDAMMNHRDLAAALKLEAEPLRKRLDRWRSKNGDGWQELTEATAKEPRYLYHVAAVRAVLREAIKAK